MANFTITDFKMGAYTFDFGSPFGVVPIVVCDIKDPWIETIGVGDTIKMNNEIALPILNFMKVYPTIILPGGSTSQLNGSTFANVSYPVSNTPLTGSHLNATVSKFVTSSNTTCLELWGASSNRLNGRCRPLYFIKIKNKLLLPRTSASIYGQNFDIVTNLNSYAILSHKNGMPYGILPENFSQYSTTYTFDIVYSVFTTLDNETYTSYYENQDPFSGGGTSEPGGGGGSFDDSTDVITEPSYDPVELLNRSYGNRGFVRVYLPTQAELTSLHAFMWDNTLIAEMQKMFNNVVDSVISLNLIPLDFTDETPNRGNILLGLVDSQIETTIAKQQFITLDCGTIEINEFFASYLDYSPYSKLQIYLPYIGVKDLDIDEFMNAYINVKYVVDIVSGACVAFISKSGAIDNAVVKNNPILGVLYQFAGNCALNVPISGANYAQVHAADIGAIISGAGIVGAFATGGMSAPAAITGVLSTAANVVTSKPSVTRGGSIPSTAGYMGIQKPYLILTRPRMCLPEDQNTFTGYPAYVTLTPGDTSGYTEFEEIHLENVPATDAEKDEIMNLMKSGVIL